MDTQMSAMIYLAISLFGVLMGGLSLLLADVFSPAPRSAEVVVRVSERTRRE